jgi:hypothetical protein
MGRPHRLNTEGEEFIQILVKTSEGKTFLSRPRYGRKDYVKMVRPYRQFLEQFSS